ncbi:sphingomyelin phosphodiesterase 2 [Bombina bombina]|uniref:sphingomyelin phosphodiesterase 2 n=1 Tax=Bombina bombina TaxID=8345 RepID=UPI00235AEDAC|nr:sphingomyelin phosphodiesterase 2 [Bombina bombina]
MQPQNSVELKIFDLNCWALRILSKKRKERLAKIGYLVIEGQYDLVLLQEIWSDIDYSELKQRLSVEFPYTHHFKSGVIGSGLCVFSRFPIMDCLQHQFSLNGFPYMINHGDWFCGKAVGLVKIRVHGFLCHVYITHLHAEYCREKDCYQSHRILQSWELAQFIRHTSRGSEVVILAGDLNMHPGDLGLRLIREWTELKDAYTECSDYEGPPNGCTLLPSNPYTNQQELKNFPQGIRIDYIMYQSNPNVSVTCRRVNTGSGIPLADMHYSDHEIVTATLCLQRLSGVKNQCRENPPASVVSPLFTACYTELRAGLHTAERWRTAFGYVTLLLIAFLILQCSSNLLFLLGSTFSFFPSTFLTILFLLISFTSLVLHSEERHQLQSVMEQMSLVESGLQEN